MCGIFGILNTEYEPFDYQTFCTLGICNDERGGDSCGVFIDGEYEYGIGNEKYFSSFFEKSKVIQNAENVKIALGHCRKASVGNVTIKEAQPVVIEKDGKPDFVVLHNGTIFNYEELAAKYIPDVNILGMTDSQVMANIFYRAGYDVLGEYCGGAVFVIVDYRKDEPEILMFKGASLASYASNVSIEERPLFLILEDGRIIFSSISKYLKCIDKENVLYTAPENHLIKVTKDCKLEKVKEYDRSKKYQFRGGQYYDYGKYGYNPSNYSYGSYSGYNKNKILSIADKTEKEQKQSQCKNIYEGLFIESNDDGTYNIGKQLAHGFFNIKRDGSISSIKDSTQGSFVFFFWQGVLLYNKECYKFLKKVMNAYNLTEGQLYEDYPLLVRSLSPDPFRDSQIFESEKTYFVPDDNDYQPFTNEQWQYFMSKNVFWFDSDGNISSSWEVGKFEKEGTFDDYRKLSNEVYIDFSFLIDTYKIY